MTTLSDDDNDFNQDIPTKYKFQVKANPEKELVVEEAKPEVDEWRPEKIVALLTKKSTTESTEVSKPPANPETLDVDKPLIDLEPSGSH